MPHYLPFIRTKVASIGRLAQFTSDQSRCDQKVKIKVDFPVGTHPQAVERQCSGKLVALW